MTELSTPSTVSMQLGREARRGGELCWLIPGWRSLWASRPGHFEQGQLRGGIPGRQQMVCSRTVMGSSWILGLVKPPLSRSLAV